MFYKQLRVRKGNNIWLPTLFVICVAAYCFSVFSIYWVYFSRYVFKIPETLKNDVIELNEFILSYHSYLPYWTHGRFLCSKSELGLNASFTSFVWNKLFLLSIDKWLIKKRKLIICHFCSTYDKCTADASNKNWFYFIGHCLSLPTVNTPTFLDTE